MPDNPVLHAKRAIVLSWSAVLAVMTLIFYASSLPGSDIPSAFVFQDIIYHFGIFFALAAVLSRAMGASMPRLSPQKIFLFTLAFTVFYGITDELHQIFTPYRSVSAFDAAVDGAGGLAGGLIYRWLS